MIGAFVDDKRSGRCFAAGDFHDMTLEDAVLKAAEYPVYTGTIGL